MTLFDYGFTCMTLTTLARPLEITGTVPVGGGLQNEVLAGNGGSVLLPSAEEKFVYETVFVADPMLLAPIKKGQTIGKLYVLYQDTAVKEYDMIALADVDAVPAVEKNLWREIKRIFNFLLL